MRNFHALVLLLAGCSADLVTEPPDPTTPDPIAMPDGASIQGRNPKVEVCHVQAWTEPRGGVAGAQLAIVPRAQGAAVLSIPPGGGALSAFAFDQYGFVTGKPEGVVVRDGQFTSVRASMVDGRVVAALSDGKQMEVDVLRDDLADFRTLSTFPGAFAAQTPILHARSTRVMPIAGEGGVSFQAFDVSWKPTTKAVLARDTPTGLASTQIGGGTGDTLTAWSTAESCGLHRLLDAQESSLEDECLAPRLSTGALASTLVFERHGHVMLAHIPANLKDTAPPVELTDRGRAPRTLFDGVHTWVSYLDRHGTVIVGILDAHGRPIAGTSIDEQPGDGSYELAMVDGAPWVFTVNDQGYFAYEVCAK